jgi:hypothetical protein
LEVVFGGAVVLGLASFIGGLFTIANFGGSQLAMSIYKFWIVLDFEIAGVCVIVGALALVAYEMVWNRRGDR